MKTSSLIAAAVVATAMLGACAGTNPTGPQSKLTSTSLELSNSVSTQGIGGSIGLDSTSAIQFCRVQLPADSTSGQISATGTYAVAYGSKTCPTAP